MEYKSPMDLIGIYLSSKHGIGQVLRIETIRKRLSVLPLIDVLDILAQLSFYADNSNMSQADYEKMTRDLLPEREATKAISIMRSDKRTKLFGSQIVSALALNALVYANPEPVEIDDKKLNTRLDYYFWPWREMSKIHL